MYIYIVYKNRDKYIKNIFIDKRKQFGKKKKNEGKFLFTPIVV